MTSNVIIDFSTYLNKKLQNDSIKKRITMSGWEIDSDFSSVNSDICIYLIDSKEPGILLFGCSIDTINSLKSEDIVSWNHFVSSWDVIIDPHMAHDDTHKKLTMELALRALLGLPEWPSYVSKALTTSVNFKAHILVIVDRENMESPVDIVVAHSKSPTMNNESIRSILNGYINVSDR